MDSLILVVVLNVVVAALMVGVTYVILKKIHRSR